MRVPYSTIYHSVCLSIHPFVCQSVCPQIFVDAAVAKVFKLPFPVLCGDYSRGVDVPGHAIGPCDLCPWRYDLELGNVLDATASRVLIPMCPICACELSMKHGCAGAWNVGPVTLDIGAVTLTLGFLWTIQCPRFWCQCSQFVHVVNPSGICHVVTLRFIHFSYVNIELQPGALIKVIVQVPTAELP